MSGTEPAAFGRDDLLTVCAIGVVAACITTVSHEALGHGLVCLSHGGTITRLTNVYFRCSIGDPWISPGGPFGNYMAALSAWLIQRSLPRTWTGPRLLFVMVMAFSLFWEAGYLLYTAVKKEGDYAFAFRDFGAGPWWPWAAAVAGVVVYWLGVRLVARAGAGFAPTAGGSAARRAAGLILPAYLAGSFAEIAAGAFYGPDRLEAMHQAALELLAANFPLLFIHPLAARARPSAGQGAPPLVRQPAWIAGGLVLLAVFVLTLGRGVPA